MGIFAAGFGPDIIDKTAIVMIQKSTRRSFLEP